MKYNTSSESSFQPANCESESERSLRSDSGYVTEKAQQKPDFILKPHTVEVKAGGTAIFLCRITGSPTPSIKWETNAKTINNDERHKITYGEECVLEIGNVTPEDSGLYTCTLTNPSGVVCMDTRLVVNNSDLPSNPPNRLPTQRKSVQLIAEEKIEQKKYSMNTSSPVAFQHKEKQVISNSVEPRSFHGDSEIKRLQKLRELEQKPQKSHEIHDFRGVLKSKVASSEKIDYKSVLKHKSNTDLSKIGEKKLSAGPELGTDFREVLSKRKKSREERVKTQNERKSNSYSEPPAKKDNSSSSIDYRSVLNRKRNSLPKGTSPVMNKENSYSVIREKSPVTAKGGQETLTRTRTPTKSRLVDSKSPSVHKDTPINSASETKLKYDTSRMETNDNLIHHQKDRERTPYKGDHGNLISPSQRRRRASPTVKQVSNPDPQPTATVHDALPSQNEDIPQPQLLKENVKLGTPTQRVDNQPHQPTENVQRGTITEKVDNQPHQPTENVQRGTITEKEDKQPHQPTENVQRGTITEKEDKQPHQPAENVQLGTPTESVDTQPNHPPVLSDVIDEGTIEHLLAKRRQKRRQSPAHKDYIPPDPTSIVNIPVLEPVKTSNGRPEGQIDTSMEPEISKVGEENGKRAFHKTDYHKEEESSHSSKTDSGRSVVADKISTHEKLKTSSDISPAVVNSQEEDFRTVLANRKNRNTNGVKDSPKDKTENESSDILSDWRTRRQQRSQDKEGLNGDSESTVENVAQESTKPKEKTRPPLSKLNLNLTVKHSENSSQNGSVKTPENNSDDFRSILSRKKRSSSSFSKYDTKDSRVPSSPKTTDFRHVLTRHVSYVENRHRQAPQFTSLLRDKSVKEGESVTMECHVTGVPRPEIMWMMNNNQIKPSKFFRMTYDDDHTARLVIAGAYPEDDGVYVCTASNSSGTETSSCHLFVKELASTTDQSEEEGGMKKEETTEDDSTCTEDEFADTLEAPVIHEINPALINTTPGQKITIQVSFTSDEKPSIEWWKGGLLLKTGDTVSISTTEHFSRLTVPQVKVTDAGNYEISVKNSIGQATAMSTVNVHDVPGQVPGRPYASDTSLRSVILSWGCPSSDGGSPVTGYRVEMCEAETEVWQTLTEQCHSTSYHVADLLPHTPYFFRVTAKNKHGFGNPSETSSVIVTKDRRSSLRLSVDSDEEDLPFEPKLVALQQDEKFEENYDLQEAIGKGKFGKVHRCLEKMSGKTFAAKIVKCRTQKEKENLKQEVEIMNLLSHPKLLMLWDAFETARSVVLVMEYVAGGELFDRVADEDLELTESDCVHFMRQICQGVQYMHLRSILHLDLKPENILCINKDNNLIKIIDFGLARRHMEGDSLRVMFGTPEFIAPEVVNYEEIGFPTDIWSVGVICYVLLSGLSPFMGDSDVETLSNVTRGDYDFDDEAFDEISDFAKDFINKTIKLNKKKRLTIDQCLEHPWLARSERNSSKKLRQSLRNLKQFMARRKWQKMGNAIRAVGRISMLQKSRSGSESSVQSDSDVSSQTDNSTLSSSRPSSVGAEGKSDLRQIKPSNNSVLNPPNPCANPSHITNPDRTEGLLKERDPQLAFLKEMVDCEAFVGDNARFDVQINGNKTAPPSVQWYHEGETIHSEGKYSVMDALSDNGEYSLIIKNVDGSNEGEYTCKATSGGHMITCSADLILNDAGAI